MTINNLAKGYEISDRRTTLGPPLSLFAAILATITAAAIAAWTLPQDAVLPLASSALFVFAAIAAAFGWRQRKAQQQASLNYWDVAGALTLIGIFAAATVEPDQMVRLVDGTR